MIQFAAAASIASAIREFASVITSAVEDPNNYKRLEALRTFVSKVTGKEIDKGAFITLLETTVVGEPYTGKWEVVEEHIPTAGGDIPGTRRLRVEGGWIYDCGRGNPLLVKDA